MRARVRRLVPVALAALVWLPTNEARAQLSQEAELAKLRQLLNLPEAAALKVAAAPSVPAATPLKVAIATGLDVRVRRNFTDWIEEWNRKEGKKVAQLKVVADPADAHVVLVRFTEREKARLTTQTTTTPDSAISASGSVTTRTTRHSYTFLQGPIYAYVLRVTGPNALEIVSRYSTLGDVDETKSSGKDLWEDFKKLLKQRGETTK
jgi:hypothetical protein